MKIAITGANGFLGSYLVKACLQQNMEVHALVRKNANTSLLPTNNNLYLHQINYTENLADQFSRLKNISGQFQYLIHNAGLTVSLKNEEYYQVNAGITESIVDSALSTNLLEEDGKFVYISSYAAHGPATINEPVSHYGRSKLQAEQAIENKIANYFFARPTGIYGSGDVAFLPLFKTAKKGLYPLTDADQRISMIHAKDLSRMIVTDMQSSNGIMYYSDGHTYYHKDFKEIFSKIFQRKIRNFPLPKWLAKLSIGSSDIWHKLINKRPGVTLEKFTEISQHWDLHNSELKHSSIKPEISLHEGFKDALH
ncbi:MAG: NAD-dependent epimerase/dehydratase family protein [Bacteroidota bacterium]